MPTITNGSDKKRASQTSLATLQGATSQEANGGANGAANGGSYANERPSAIVTEDLGDKRHHVYKVLVSAGRRSWYVIHRYSDFQKLYDKLKKLYPDAHLKLPGKKFFGNLDPSFHKHRVEGLHEFVQVLVSNAKLCDDGDVSDFLELDHGLNDSSSDDTEGDEEGSSGSISVDLGPSEKQHAHPSDFEFLRVIGKGSFGKVLLAKHKAEGRLYAVKVLNKVLIIRKRETDHIMCERNVLLKNVRHPFLIGLHYSFQTPDKLYFVLDYVNGGEVFFHLQKERVFPEPRARFYVAEIASALGYLHSIGIIYRDLKPENILLDSQGHIVLTDFGLCKEGFIGKVTTSTFCGTPEYLAPEILRKEPYDITVDWWCLGAVLYEMLFGLPPFYSKQQNEMYDNILNKPLRFRNNYGSPDSRNLLEGLLQKDKTKRLGAHGDINEVRQHVFFASLDWSLLEKKKLPPPFDPHVSDSMDFKNIDPAFVQEPVPESVALSADISRVSDSVREAETAFAGFSYVQSSDDHYLE